MKRILVTGGAGFIGHHTVEHLVRKTDWNIIVLDKLSYATNGMDKLKSAGIYNHDRVRVYTWDLVCPLSDGLKKEIGQVQYILHIAAESDVNRSIANPVPFIQNNIQSTLNMLEYARELGDSLEKFYMFSTDETRGVPTDGYAFKESDGFHPRNPYSASKASCEMICMAYENTYKVPIIISEMVNCIGQRQHVEKFVPKVIRALLTGEELVIHADPTGTIPGSRCYIHSRNTADAVLFLLRNGHVGESYNICTKDEIDNLEIARRISKIVKKPLKYKLVDFHSERAGHDLVYRLDGTKLRELGWTPPVDFNTSLEATVKWYLQYPQWLEE